MRPDVDRSRRDVDRGSTIPRLVSDRLSSGPAELCDGGRSWADVVRRSALRRKLSPDLSWPDVHVLSVDADCESWTDVGPKSWTDVDPKSCTDVDPKSWTDVDPKSCVDADSESCSTVGAEPCMACAWICV